MAFSQDFVGMTNHPLMKMHAFRHSPLLPFSHIPICFFPGIYRLIFIRILPLPLDSSGRYLGLVSPPCSMCLLSACLNDFRNLYYQCIVRIGVSPHACLVSFSFVKSWLERKRKPLARKKDIPQLFPHHLPLYGYFPKRGVLPKSKILCQLGPKAATEQVFSQLLLLTSREKKLA